MKMWELTTFLFRCLSNNFHIKKSKCFFYQGHNQKLAEKRGLYLTAIRLSVSYKRWFGVKPFEVNATVATYWYCKKMQTNKMLSKAFNFALNIDKRSASKWNTKHCFRSWLFLKATAGTTALNSCPSMIVSNHAKTAMYFCFLQQINTAIHCTISKKSTT